MIKAALMSVAVALVALPLLAARDRGPARGLKRALVAVVLFNLVYALTLQLMAHRIPG